VTAGVTYVTSRPRRRDPWLTAWAIIRRDRQSLLGLAILVVFLVIAVVGPWLVGPIDRTAANRPLLPPSMEHLFGTDRAGRDLFITNVWATRISLLVGVVASFLSMVIGAGIGISAGYLGGGGDA
jgi:ABC-type dipeptide/oligopeptide/nickel transport system permease subunit